MIIVWKQAGVVVGRDTKPVDVMFLLDVLKLGEQHRKEGSPKSGGRRGEDYNV